MKQVTKHVLFASATLLPACAQAQTAAPVTDNAQQTTAGSTGLEDIIVTASRRREDLQQVPVVIQAFSGDSLKALNVKGVDQLSTLVPGLVVTQSGGNNIFLRGVGSSSLGFAEGQVAVYVDGIYLANPSIGIYSFNNIDQVEVLKGPQGTLYGRNATGGLISVTTRDPGSSALLDVSAGYGNYDTIQGNFYGSAPLTDNLAANVAVLYQDQHHGFGRNVFTGNDNLKSNEIGVQSKLQWQAGNDIKATLGFIYDYNDRDVGFALGVTKGTVGTDGTMPLGQYQNASRIDPYAPLHVYIGSFKVEADLGFANLLSTSAYQVARQTALFQSASGIVGQPVLGQSAAYVPLRERGRTFSQEFQLTSKHSASSRFDWVAGAFLFKDDQRLIQGSYGTCVGTTCAPPIPSYNDSRPDTRSYSGYADGTLHLFSATKVTLGLRYTDETKHLTGMAYPLADRPNSVAVLPGSPTAAVAPAGTTVFYPGQSYYVNGILQPGIPNRLHFDKLTYRAVIAQDVGENVHLYASHNLGFKSGAFNPNSYTNPPVKPELLYATEAGAKSELFDRALRLNVAYFHYTYKNLQLRSVAPPALPGQVLLLNIASQRVDGVDADFLLAAAPGLTINGAVEYLNAKYTDYPGATCLTPGTRTVAGVTYGTVASAACNLAGYRVVNAPPVSASLGFTYARDTDQGKFKLSANARYLSRTPQVADGSFHQSAYAVADASLGWTPPSKRFDVQLWVKNLTDTYYYVSTQAATNYASLPGAPRTFGFTVGFHYF